MWFLLGLTSVVYNNKNKFAMPSSPKPLLETVEDILNISLDILKHHEDTGKGSIPDAEKAIANVKKAIDDYKKAQSDVPYPTLEDMKRKG